jgi:Epoxide hydrolase N terminus
MSATEVAQQTASDTAIRPFEVGFPEAELAELRGRINATRWPERETVSDDSQGVRLEMMQELARYWGADYAVEQLLRPARGLRAHHVDPSANVVRAGGLTRRPRGVRARPWRWQRPARARGKGSSGHLPQRPHQRRPARQHHALLAHEHRRLRRSSSSPGGHRRSLWPPSTTGLGLLPALAASCAAQYLSSLERAPSPASYPAGTGAFSLRAG